MDRRERIEQIHRVSAREQEQLGKTVLYKIKVILIRLVTISILCYFFWMVLQRVSPTINPPKTSVEKIERDYRGAIKIDMKQETFE